MSPECYERKKAKKRQRYKAAVSEGRCCECGSPAVSAAYCGVHLVAMRKRVKRALLRKLKESGR
jgi:hypothetical protein